MDDQSEAGPIDPIAARTALRAEREHLVAELHDDVDVPEQMTYGSQAAAASQVFAQQRGLALRERAAQHLTMVDDALGRLDAGTYGTCARCQGPIASGRLEALPWAALCIDCQSTVDRGQR
jgi:DnaK suppressor protein